ncbi:hypothetical protein ACFVHB_29840 [Kitasatospora sp. NPDC127111]|uniref:hypothetical protein n=1 Tax=Kitasatospora sp. NPDC127111 TaxID=3345363 RepID=UPI00363884EC
MAHLSIIVCLPASAAPHVDEAVAEAMRPFLTEGEGPVEHWMWDSYRIRAGLPVLAGHESDPRLITTRPWRDGTPEPDAPGRTAGAPRGLVDFRDALRAEAAEHAGRVHDRWQDVAARHPGAEPEEAFYHRHLAAGGTHATYGTSREAAAYRAQPALLAWAREAPALARPDIADHFRFAWAPVHISERTREQYTEVWAASVVPSHNVLTLDGWWYEPGEQDHPLHGTCASPAECHHRPGTGKGWPGVLAYLLALPADTLLVNTHCHV